MAMAEECFMCLDERKCNLVDGKILALIEFLLPEITIIKMGIPLHVCYVCDEKLQLFSEFKLACLENSQCLEATVRKKTRNDRTTQTCPQDTLDFDKEPDTSILEYYESQINKYLQEEQTKHLPKPTMTSTQEIQTENCTLETNIQQDNTETCSNKNNDVVNNMSLEKVVLEPLQNPNIVNLHDNGSTDYFSQYQLQLQTGMFLDFVGAEVTVPEESIDTTIDYNSVVVFNNNEKYDERDSQASSDATFSNVHHIVTDHDYLDLDTFCTKLFTKTLKTDLKYGDYITTEKYHCAVCDQYFIDKHSLVPHMNDHRRISDFKCSKCYRRFQTLPNLTKHLRKHLNHNTFKCISCKRAFQTLEKLNVHMDSHRLIHECKICSKKFTHSSLLNNHSKTHTRTSKHRCQECKYYFYGKEALHTHSLIAHPSNYLFAETKETDNEKKNCDIGGSQSNSIYLGGRK